MDNDWLKPTLPLLKPADLKEIPSGEHFTQNNTELSIRCVLFDIYGTLIISASGDVDCLQANKSSLTTSLSLYSHVVANQELLPSDEEFAQAFKTQICLSQDKRRSEKIRFPEIDTPEVWQNTLRSIEALAPYADCIQEQHRAAILIYEWINNPVSLMSEAQEILDYCRERLPMGIVSNAQFYTPIIVNYLLYGMLNASEEIAPFRPDLTSYSYCLQRGKPDPEIYRVLVSILQKNYGIEPHEVLMVGNDMLNDIYAASQVGFRTALFAGDQRSLRWRKDHPDASKIRPDVVLSRLSDLKRLI